MKSNGHSDEKALQDILQMRCFGYALLTRTLKENSSFVFKEKAKEIKKT